MTRKEFLNLVAKNAGCLNIRQGYFMMPLWKL